MQQFSCTTTKWSIISIKPTISSTIGLEIGQHTTIAATATVISTVAVVAIAGGAVIQGVAAVAA